MRDEKPRRDRTRHGVKRSSPRAERHQRIHISRLVKKSRPGLRIKTTPRPKQNECCQSEEEPANSIVTHPIDPRQRLSQNRIKHPHIPTHQRIFHALHAANTAHAHQRHGQDHGEKPRSQAYRSLQTKLPVFAQLFCIVFCLLFKNRMLSRNLSAVTSPSDSVHQRRGRGHTRIKRHRCIVQHQIDRCGLHTGLAGQGPLNKRLACRAGHPRNGNRDVFRRDGRYSSSVCSTLGLQCIRHDDLPMTSQHVRKSRCD